MPPRRSPRFAHHSDGEPLVIPSDVIIELRRSNEMILARLDRIEALLFPAPPAGSAQLICTQGPTVCTTTTAPVATPLAITIVPPVQVTPTEQAPLAVQPLQVEQDLSAIQIHAVQIPYKMNFLIQFQKLKPPKYDGSMDYQMLDDWLIEMEKIFMYTGIAVEQMVPLAAYQLEGIAYSWWASEQQNLIKETFTWDDFKACILKKFIPSVEQHRWKNAFLHLRQGHHTVREYEIEFTKLSRFALDMVDTQTKLVNRFQDGLRIDIQQFVSSYGALTYNEVVEAALRIEAINDIQNRDNDQNRKKRPHYVGESGYTNIVPTKRQAEKCTFCNKMGHNVAVCRRLQAQKNTL